MVGVGTFHVQVMTQCLFYITITQFQGYLQTQRISKLWGLCDHFETN